MRQERNSQKKECSLGAGFWFLLKEDTQQYLQAVLQELNAPLAPSLPVGEVDCLLPARILTPHQLEPEGWWCWLPVTSPPTNQKNVPALSTPSLNHHYAASHYPLQAGIHSSVGSSPLCPPLSGQTVKLLFSTSSKTLSLRFNLASGYKDQIRLQEYTRSLWKININADVCVKISSVTSPVAIPNSNSLC